MYSSTELSYYIISLGCSKNLVDSEEINASFLSAGFLMAQSVEEADIIIVNTCGFIQPAKEESIAVLFDALQAGDEMLPGGAPEHSFHKRVVAVGCLTERYMEEMKVEMPELDLIYGIPDRGLVEALSKQFSISILPSGAENNKKEPLIEGLPYRYIKIAEGCSNNCSYCAIPLIRGPHRSFDPAIVLEDAREAVRKGAMELLVVAQDIAAYRHSGLSLAGLVNEISAIEGVRWIRLLYCHPDHVDDSIIDLIRDNDRVVPYIDIPFQHVSASLVSAMGRGGNAGIYLDLVRKIRDRVPDIRIRSTFMVGFPGEGKKEFAELLDFVKKAALDKVGVFPYFSEEGTAASQLKETVSTATKEKRSRELMLLQQEISRSKLSAMVGTDVDVLVEEQIDENNWAGRTLYDAPEVDGIFYLTGKDIVINSIVKARVTGAIDYDLSGVPV